MPANMAPTIIGVDGSSGSRLALRWAMQDAALGSVPVRLVCCYRRPITLSWEGTGPNDADREADAAQQFAQETVAKALELAGELAPELDVAGDAVYGHAADVLVERSASASQVVVGSRQLKGLGSALLGSVGAGLAARAVCPVVVVRGPSGLPAEHPAVVVGVDGSDAAGPALEFGFDHARRHGVPLRAVMCWRPDPLATMRWRAEAPVPERAREWLSETLAAWQQRYPDVVASGAVIRDHAVAGLVEQSAAQQLLVLRSRAHSALTGALLGSITQGVLHHATAPVAVIPAGIE